MTERATIDDGESGGRTVLFDGEPRTVTLSLAADERVPAHSHPDCTVLFCVLSGAVDLDLDGEPHRLEAGELLRFDGGRQVSPRARTDARALVVLAET